MSFWSDIEYAAPPASITKSSLPVGSLPDGNPVRVPVMVVRGGEAGPTVWVQACVHGSEVGAQRGLTSFVHGLGDADLRRLRGTIIALPIVNVLAYYFAARHTPVDQENLNRVFPGKPGGGYTAHLASVLSSHAVATADVVVDLHSGGDRAVVPYYALVYDGGNAASERAKQIARHVGTDVLWVSKEPWLDGALFTYASKQGVPAVLIECGGGTVTQAQVDVFRQSIGNVVTYLGMLDGASVVQESYTYVSKCHFVHPRAGGIFVPRVAAGDRLAPATPLGDVYDAYGDIVEHLVSPPEPTLVTAIRRENTAMFSGDFVAECVRIEGEEVVGQG